MASRLGHRQSQPSARFIARSGAPQATRNLDVGENVQVFQSATPIRCYHNFTEFGCFKMSDRNCLQHSLTAADLVRGADGRFARRRRCLTTLAFRPGLVTN